MRNLLTNWNNFCSTEDMTMLYGLNERYTCCLSYSTYVLIVISSVLHIKWENIAILYKMVNPGIFFKGT